MHGTTLVKSAVLIALCSILCSVETPRAEEPLADLLAGIDAQMVRVDGGSFTMGCTQEQYNCGNDEKPLRQVSVHTFWIGRYEVTQQIWEAVMGRNPSAFSDCPECPVETVSWDDVQAFLKRLNAAGGHYRLPSEAEWEYAARGGRAAQGYVFSGGNDYAPVAWYYENSDNRTQPVGKKRDNELGIFDMSGNVREWVQDCWQATYEAAPTVGQPWESGNCERRVMRGGSWYGKPSYVRSANRFWYTTYFRNNNLGFRIAR